MEPFKEQLNESVVRQLGKIFSRVHPLFDEKAFVDQSLNGLGELELKERVTHIMDLLCQGLPSEFEQFSDVITGSLHPNDDPADGENIPFGPAGVTGFPAWPVTDLVTKRGIDYPAKALPLLKKVTSRFSAEFAIRPFLDIHTDYTLGILTEWLTDENRHTRRLVSEGTRPRLPWGMQLKKFIADPAPIMPLLQALRDDPEEYVRRSVANNLNDIAKDHPDFVAEVAADWLKGADKNRRRLVKHACRTLIKQGHAGALAAFGYTPIDSLKADLDISTATVAYGESLAFKIAFKGLNDKQKLMVDYAIHFVKANGKRAPKVFKWKDAAAAGNSLTASRMHAIKPITTRKYYGGEHLLEIFVNGQSVATAPFELKLS
jgi:3-methyladenine DNA glycosylase AlkC